MSNARYTVTINKLGDAKVEAEGFVGVSCEDATKAVELALAGKDVRKDYKDEYYEAGEGQHATENLRF